MCLVSQKDILLQVIVKEGAILWCMNNYKHIDTCFLLKKGILGQTIRLYTNTSVTD